MIEDILCFEYRMASNGYLAVAIFRNNFTNFLEKIEICIFLNLFKSVLQPNIPQRGGCSSLLNSQDRYDTLPLFLEYLRLKIILE